MSKPAYLMESPAEGERLAIKSDGVATRSQLRDFGLGSVPVGATVVDAGSGIGHIAAEAQTVIEETNGEASVILLDGSAERLEKARKDHCRSSENVRFDFRECQLSEIPLEANSVDFVVCRFVFEYLKDPAAAFDEFVRITRPGGKILVGDLDQNCLNHFPLSIEMQSQLSTLVEAVSKATGFDPYAGRKIFSHFHRHGLKDTEIRMYAHHLFHGALRKSDYRNWEMKLEQMEMLEKEGLIKVGFSISDFKKSFMTFLTRNDRFTYTPLIMVGGIKS